tara:strand:+ start:421 stop:1005 length:585 start_codon:yes stop_codon:yes gene_type:complete
MEKDLLPTWLHIRGDADWPTAPPINNTVNDTLSGIVLRHGRHLSFLRQSVEPDFIIPDIFDFDGLNCNEKIIGKTPDCQHNTRSFYKTGGNKIISWHQQNQDCYLCRVELFRDALYDYEMFSGQSHSADVLLPMLEEIPNAVPNGKDRDKNKNGLRLQLPLSKLYLTLVGLEYENKTMHFESLETTRNLGFNFN